MEINPLKSWEAVAEYWDAEMGIDGNDYFKGLELPALERMVQLKPGDRALDLATGNGLVARWLCRGGASVVATDGSASMIQMAKQRGSEANIDTENTGDISYQLLDVTNPQMFDEFTNTQLSKGGPFDIVTMNMAIMDVATLEPLAQALPRLLKKDGGRFVATLLHPLITCGSVRAVEFEDNPTTGKEEARFSMRMTKYLHVPPSAGVAMQHQPVHQIYYHRPIHEILSCFFRAGLVVDAVEEPNFDDNYVEANTLALGSLRRLTQFPKILAFRLRVAGGTG